MNHLRPSAGKNGRGGRRPGAGAPKGNLNALKHGLRSAQFARLGAILASIPQTRAALLSMARRHRLRQRRAEEVAALLLSRLIQRGIQIGNLRSNAQPPIHERRTIKQDAHQPPASRFAAPPGSENLASTQSNPEPNPPPTIENQIRKQP